MMFDWREAVICFVWSIFVAFVFLVGLTFYTGAIAHDIWINKQGERNPAGAWCCGVSDCGVIPPESVTVGARGYSLHGVVIYGEEATGSAEDGETKLDPVNESVPFSEAQPSPDGQYWRCKNYDMTRRCFFAPPPNS